MFQAGNTDNVIPQTALLKGTARSLDPKVRDLLEARLHAGFVALKSTGSEPQAD